MRIFAGVPLGGVSSDSVVVDNGNFLAIWVFLINVVENVGLLVSCLDIQNFRVSLGIIHTVGLSRSSA